MKYVRGDTQPFKFKIIDKDGNDVAISDIETLFITCRKEPSVLSPILFQKTLRDVTVSDGYYHATFTPQETQSLCLGKYYFDIEVTLKNGYRKSRLSTIDLTAETTIHGGGA